MPAHGHHGHIGTTLTEANPHCGAFGYLFPEADGPPFVEDTPTKVDALQIVLFEQDDADDGNISDLPPVFTYLGQFIDHDITLQAASIVAALPVIDIFGPTGSSRRIARAWPLPCATTAAGGWTSTRSTARPNRATTRR